MLNETNEGRRLLTEQQKKERQGLMIAGGFMLLLLICAILATAFICHVRYTNKYEAKIDEVKSVYNTEKLNYLEERNRLY